MGFSPRVTRPHPPSETRRRARARVHRELLECKVVDNLLEDGEGWDDVEAAIMEYRDGLKDSPDDSVEAEAGGVRNCLNPLHL